MDTRGAEGPRILVADDDEEVRSALESVLRFGGYEVEVAGDGLETLAAIDRSRPDALLLDWRMPQLDGPGTCRLLRGRGDDLPVLLLTARDEPGACAAGLDAGADDYLTKPFEMDELLARLRALLRRARGFRSVGEDAAPEEVLRFVDLVMNVDTRQVRRGGRALRLTRTEFDLLELLMRRPRRVLSRSWIHEQIWGFDFGRASGSLHVYIGYLRRKTEAGGEPRLLHTVRGVGYALREEPV